MTRRTLITLALIIILIALALAEVVIKDSPSIQDVPPGNNALGMRLGLDLSGGIHLVYEADLSQIGEGEDPAQAMQGAIEIIQKRVDAYGVTEPIIQKQGENRISVQLPGVRNMEEAVSLIGQTAQLDYREMVYDSNGNPVPDENGQPTWIPATAVDSSGQNVPLTGKYLKRNTQVVIDETTNEPRVAFEFNDEGANLFQQITGRLIGKPLGIFLDNRLISAPTVKSQIGAKGVIENIGLEEAQNLAILLNAGALPVPLGHWEHGTFLSGPAVEDQVDPTLGADSLRKSLIAGVIGLALVILFMMFYYRLPGVMAGLALLMYCVLVLAAFKLIPVTLTLSGIAAFIVSIGMAVDANVLIFERMKEELRAGRTLGGAIETGFSRAWPAIRDSNLTTLIVCAILYWMGNQFAEPRVMGFALTLAVGVLLSMFSAIAITKTFLRPYVGSKLESRLWLFGLDRLAQAPLSKEQK